MRSKKYHKLVNTQRMDPQDAGWNAYILSTPGEDVWDHNPFESSEWPENEKWNEFCTGWYGAEREGVTEDDLITRHLRD